MYAFYKQIMSQTYFKNLDIQAKTILPLTMRRYKWKLPCPSRKGISVVVIKITLLFANKGY